MTLALDFSPVETYDHSHRMASAKPYRPVATCGRLLSLIAASVLLASASSSMARTLVLDGGLASAFHVTDRAVLGMPAGIEQFSYFVVPPPTVVSKTSQQTISNYRYAALPKPSAVQESTDPYGNKTVKLTWQAPTGEIQITSDYDVRASVDFAPLPMTAPYPLPTEGLPREVARYLEPSEQVQSQDQEIRSLAAELVKGATTEQEAVTKILHWVVDHLHYQLEPAGYDALLTKREGKGNCQNYSHLSAALLRAAGIPARMVRGRTLDKAWEVDEGNGKRRWTSRWAAGRHAWIDIYYPDQGWLMYDSQAYHVFVSTRFIRMEAGPDNKAVHTDGLMSWRSRGNEQPKILDMRVEAEFSQDQDVVKAQRVDAAPQKLLYAPNLKGAAPPPVPVLPPPPPPPPAPPAAKLKPSDFDFPVVFGNLEFPNEIRLFEPAKQDSSGQFSMEGSYVVETAEYVSGDQLYAQALEPERPVLVKDFSLALHRFGGDQGELWVEIYGDGGDGPGELLVKSRPVKASAVRTPPNRYAWVPFSFEGTNTILPAGRHWILLRQSGDAIVNWFYLYGKVVSPEDGTRTRPKTAQGPAWNQILNIEFNFRLRGLVSLKDS